MNSTAGSGTDKDLFRHALAALAYRAGKAVRGAPESFGEFRGAVGLRTPCEILAHMGDLFDWALSIAQGRQVWRDSTPLAWEKEVARFFATLRSFDEYLASGAELHESFDKLFQGPVSDALTHVGQIAMLRRMAGAAVKAENYHKAEIVAGRVGMEQSAPRREF
jgi:hypothetical protein